jgi:hypothetical protein
MSTNSAQAASTGSFVAIPIAVKPGKSQEEVLAAIRPIMELIRKAPGLMEEVLLESSFPNYVPTHVDLMHWKERKDWESLFAKAEFLAAIDASGDVFSLAPAQVFTEVRI